MVPLVIPLVPMVVSFVPLALPVVPLVKSPVVPLGEPRTELNIKIPLHSILYIMQYFLVVKLSTFVLNIKHIKLLFELGDVACRSCVCVRACVCVCVRVIRCRYSFSQRNVDLTLVTLCHQSNNRIISKTMPWYQCSCTYAYLSDRFFSRWVKKTSFGYISIQDAYLSNKSSMLFHIFSYLYSYISVQPGHTYGFILKSTHDVGTLSSIDFRWEHDSDWYNPLTWSILSHPALFIETVDIVNGETQMT